MGSKKKSPNKKVNDITKLLVATAGLLSSITALLKVVFDFIINFLSLD